MQNLIKRLEKRGWKKKDISKAVSIIKSSKRNKESHKIFWVICVLGVVLTITYAISFLLDFLLVFLNGFFMYAIIFALGISFGLLTEISVRSIEQLEKKHHFFLAIAIPLVSFIAIFFFILNSNLFARIKEINDSAIVSLVYSFSFAMPYLVYRFIFKKEYYSA